MCSSPSCLGYALLTITVGFAGLIYLCLRLRKGFQAENRQILPDQVWKQISRRIAKINLSQSDLLFGIWEDQSLTTVALVVKNQNNEVVGRVEYPMGSRRLKVALGDEIFNIDFQLTWKRTATLTAADNKNILATYSQYKYFGKHKFDIPDYGTLFSQRAGFSFPVRFNYLLNNQILGTIQEISARRKIGRLIIIPSSLPAPIRIFMLAV